MRLWNRRPCQCRKTVGKKLTPAIKATTIPALAAIPTSSNIAGNLSELMTWIETLLKG